MLQHTFLLIYRNFRRFRSTFFINLLGLSTGLAGVLLIYLWVNDELHVDKYHEKDKRLFQVMENQQEKTGVTTRPDIPHQLAEALAAEMPQVEYATTVTPPAFFPKFRLSVQNQYVKGAGKYAGKDFFNLLSYELTQGQKDQVLADKNAVVRLRTNGPDALSDNRKYHWQNDNL